MNRRPRAILGGAVGTALLSLSLLALGVQARSRIGFPAVVARYAGVPDSPVLGFVIFVLANALVWPLVFAALGRRLPGGDPVVRAIALSIPLWLAFVVAGRGDLAGPVLVIYVGFSFLAYLAYGVALGVVYARLEPSR